MAGKTLCRPKGYLTHDLEGNGRNWLSKGLVKVVNPNTVADCYALLEKGEVDAVSLSDFVGRAAIKDLGIEDKVLVVETRPQSIEGLHVVVGKSHPQADEMLALINTGLATIKASGEYQRILDTHMSRIWSEF